MNGGAASEAAKRRIAAAELTVGDWLVVARRQVAAVESDEDGALTVETVSRSGARHTNRWLSTTPVIIGPMETRRPVDSYGRSP
jgi:hypothetical protein